MQLSFRGSGGGEALCIELILICSIRKSNSSLLDLKSLILTLGTVEAPLTASCVANVLRRPKVHLVSHHLAHGDALHALGALHTLRLWTLKEQTHHITDPC